MLHFATSAAYPDLTEDDRRVLPLLAARGIACRPLAWRSDRLPAPGDTVLIRSCWDYHLHVAEFAAWLQALDEAGVQVANGAGVLRWNLHKRYLLDLQARGLARLPPTVLLPRGSDCSLAQVAATLGGADLVVKPAVSLSAHGTWRASGPGDEARFARQLAGSDLLVQAFVPAIQTEGELSLVFLDGRFSHAVRKRPRSGDFRVQSDFGGSVAPVQADAEAIADATRLLQGAAPDSTYARVDLVQDGEACWLMELELIDPVLFLRQDPAAPQRFADAIASRLRRG